MANEMDVQQCFQRLRWLNKAEHSGQNRAPVESEAFDLFLQIGAVVVADMHRIAAALERRERRDSGLDF